MSIERMGLAVVLWVIGALAGCGDDDATVTPLADAGSVEDGGDVPSDGGGMTDAGAGGDDAAPPLDAGPPAVVFTETEWTIIETLSPLPAVPADPTNAHADDPAAAALGQQLFFDARYAGPLAVASDLGAMGESGRVSCASCHASVVMSDDRSTPDNVSLGANFHARNAPALVNSALYPWTNWGGRFSAQWELPPVVAEAGVIMNSSRLAITHHVFDHYRTEYEAVFGAMEPAIGTDFVRFPATGKPMASDGNWETMAPGDQAIVNRIWINYGKAIAAYVRLLVSGESAFDRFVAGDETALGQDAQRGLRLFIGDARCVSCHSGPTFSDGRFHNIGVPQIGEHVPASDDGRWKDVPGLLASPFNSAGTYSDDPAVGAARLAGLTNPPPEEVRGAFRTPTLRDIADSAPYMHSGQFATIEDVIQHYDVGASTPTSGELDSLVLPLGLSDQDRADLAAFLESLSGEPVPEALRTAP